MSTIAALREKYLKRGGGGTGRAEKSEEGGGGGGGVGLNMGQLPWDQIGLVTAAAVVYFGVKQWAEEQAYIGTVDVSPPPEAFDRDEAICMSFQKMGKLANRIDPKTFTMAVRYMDRILLLERRLIQKEIQPRFGDIKMVQANMRRVTAALKTLQFRCKSDANAYCIMRREYTYIVERMRHHYRIIYNHCQHIRL